MYIPSGNYSRALRHASQAMIAEGEAEERALEASQFDAHFTIDSPYWPRREPYVSSYVDDLDQGSETIDFAGLQHYIFVRRGIEFKKQGIVYDPIDDDGFIPLPHREDLWSMMRPDQLEQHLDGILSSGAAVQKLAHYLSETAVEQHRTELVAAGVDIKTPKAKTLAGKIATLFGRG